LRKKNKKRSPNYKKGRRRKGRIKGGPRKGGTAMEN
jgi:hypothetical protein